MRPGERGVALLAAVFVLVLLSAIGIALLFASRADVSMSQADTRAKKVFYLAEAAVQTARDQVRVNDKTSASPANLDDELTAAAGGNGVIDFDPDNLQAVYDAAGKVTGFTGYGDDVPIRPFTALADGWYAAFLTNDPLEGKTNQDDGDGKLMVTGIGASRERSLEEAQAIIERPITATSFPATIMLLGPDPVFDGGDSAAKEYDGDDCQGAAGYTGVPGAYVPVVGTIGADAVSDAQPGVVKPNTYSSGPNLGTATVGDVSGSIQPLWTNCQKLLELALYVKEQANYICTSASPCSHWATSTITTITFVQGDVTVPGGKGLLLVTGRMSMTGGDSWDGAVLVIGKGEVSFSGGGSGHNYGGTIVANIAGPDRVLFTGDDCSASPDGFASASYVSAGGGNKDTIFCSQALALSLGDLPFKEISFRQR